MFYGYSMWLSNGNKFVEIFEEYKWLVADRPSLSTNFFQGYMREFDVIARIALMHHYNDLCGKGFSRYPMKYETINYEGFISKLQIPMKENPGIDWYKSALFRFEVLDKPKNIGKANRKLRIKFVDEEEDVTHPSVFSGGEPYGCGK